jgi:hypothetical protein
MPNTLRRRVLSQYRSIGVVNHGPDNGWCQDQPEGTGRVEIPLRQTLPLTPYGTSSVASTGYAGLSTLAYARTSGHTQAHGGEVEGARTGAGTRRGSGHE